MRKNVDDNVIYVSNGYGTAKQYGRTLNLDEMHFISGNPWEGVEGPVDIMFKNRHTPHIMRGKFCRTGERQWVIESEEDVRASPRASSPSSTTRRAICATAAALLLVKGYRLEVKV